MDKSNGYEEAAEAFLMARSNPANRIGVSTVKSWIKSFPTSSKILDLGCGSGIPISKMMIDQGMDVFGIDSSPTLVSHFKKNFPQNHIRCESVADSLFYSLEFDGIIAWGLMFLLPRTAQLLLIEKVGQHLKADGQFLFTSPFQKAKWKDILTGHLCESLGAPAYYEIFRQNKIAVLEEYADEGDNHYYSCKKM